MFAVQGGEEGGEVQGDEAAGRAFPGVAGLLEETGKAAPPQWYL